MDKGQSTFLPFRHVFVDVWTGGRNLFWSMPSHFNLMESIMDTIFVHVSHVLAFQTCHVQNVCQWYLVYGAERSPIIWYPYSFVDTWTAWWSLFCYMSNHFYPMGSIMDSLSSVGRVFLLLGHTIDKMLPMLFQMQLGKYVDIHNLKYNAVTDRSCWLNGKLIFHVFENF